jgi:proteasome lid subunit RPN8/RPN11
METFYIRRAAFEFILEAARNVYPKEFSGLLRGEKNLITESLVIPLTTYGNKFATTRFDMIPIDHTIIGSVHSHPSSNFTPSSADLRYFGRLGKVHLIIKYPHEKLADIAAYDRDGKRVELVLVD